jgi:hypothetical protein
MTRSSSARRAWVYAGLAALVLAIGYFTLPGPVPEHRETPPKAAPAASAAPAPRAPVSAPAPARAVASAPADDPAAEWQAFTRFRERTQSFLRDGRNLPPERRRDEAEALSEQVQRYAGDRHLAGGEAMMLEIELTRIGVDDPAELESRLNAIAGRYRQAAEQAAEADAAAPDPRFLDYKAREKEIVARVMAMPEIPGGIDRDEYLRQELQTAREQAYARH